MEKEYDVIISLSPEEAQLIIGGLKNQLIIGKSLPKQIRWGLGYAKSPVKKVLFASKLEVRRLEKDEELDPKTLANENLEKIQKYKVKSLVTFNEVKTLDKPLDPKEYNIQIRGTYLKIDTEVLGKNFLKPKRFLGRIFKR